MKYRVWLGLLIILSLGLFGCGLLPKLAGLADRDAPAATPVPQSAAQEQPTATPQTAGDAGGGAGDEKPVGEVGDYGELKSYRLYAKKTDQENGQVSETTTACVLDPFALHTISQGGDGSMEMIAVDNTVWMRFSDQEWYKTEFTPEEIADLEKELDLDQELDDLPDIPPWPQDILYLPGQVPVSLVEGGLTPDGKETINGVSCARYKVETNYRYEMDMPMLGQIDTTVQATGTIWVADQRGLPRIIMQADVYETETTVSPAGETTSTVRIEHQVTEINEPIAIEPPEGAVEMGSDIMPDMDDPSLPTDDLDDEAFAAALDDLSSYRLERTVTVKQDDDETQHTYLFEWIKEPPIYRTVVDMGEVMFEHLWAGDKVWTRVGGGDWIEISADEAPDPLDNLGDGMGASEGMTPDGEETVNGIRCKCYITEITMPQATGFHRICIADQPGIPPLVIYGLMQIEQQGITTITESNLYDINQPFTIETPE